MSKFTESIRYIGVFNAHGFAGHGNPFITYCPSTTGLGSRYAQWAVIRPGYKTDPDGHWMDYGNKVFPVACTAAKELQLDAAKEWAAARYGIKEWAKTPYGSWMDAGFVKRRVSELKQQLKQQ